MEGRTSRLWGSFLDPIEEDAFLADNHYVAVRRFRGYASIMCGCAVLLLADVLVFWDSRVETWRSMDVRLDMVDDLAARRTTVIALLGALATLSLALALVAQSAMRRRVRQKGEPVEEGKPTIFSQEAATKSPAHLVSAGQARTALGAMAAAVALCWVLLAAAAALQHAAVAGSLSFLVSMSYVLLSYSPFSASTFILLILLPTTGVYVAVLAKLGAFAVPIFFHEFGAFVLIGWFHLPLKANLPCTDA
jgi:hypothetical protein